MRQTLPAWRTGLLRDPDRDKWAEDTIRRKSRENNRRWFSWWFTFDSRWKQELWRLERISDLNLFTRNRRPGDPFTCRPKTLIMEIKDLLVAECSEEVDLCCVVICSWTTGLPATPSYRLPRLANMAWRSRAVLVSLPAAGKSRFAPFVPSDASFKHDVFVSRHSEQAIPGDSSVWVEAPQGGRRARTQCE